MPSRKLTTEFGIHAAWTPLQTKFVLEYFRCGMNAARAARAAGSKAARPESVGYQLLQVKHVAAAIEIQKQKNLAEIEADIQWQIRVAWMVAAFTDRTELYDKAWSPIPKEQLSEELRSLVEGVVYQTNSAGETVVTLKLISKLKAQERLAKAVGLMKERNEIDTSEMEDHVQSTQAKVEALRDALMRKAESLQQARAQAENPEESDRSS